MTHLDFVLTPENVKDLGRAMRPDRKRLFVVFLLFFTLPLLGVLLLFVGSGYLALAVSGWWLFIVFLALFLLVGLGLILKNFKAELPLVLGEERHRVEIGDEGVRYIAPRFEEFFRWSAVSGWSRQAYGVVIVSEARGKQMIIPASAFRGTDEIELDQFVSALGKRGIAGELS